MSKELLQLSTKINACSIQTEIESLVSDVQLMKSYHENKDKFISALKKHVAVNSLPSMVKQNEVALAHFEKLIKSLSEPESITTIELIKISRMNEMALEIESEHGNTCLSFGISNDTFVDFNVIDSCDLMVGGLDIYDEMPYCDELHDHFEKIMTDTLLEYGKEPFSNRKTTKLSNSLIVQLISETNGE